MHLSVRSVVCSSSHSPSSRHDVTHASIHADKQMCVAGASRPAQPGRQGSTDVKSEVKRILAATSHYSVLEVETTAGEDSIRKARRNKSLVVHPDKTDVAGARDAFDRVTNVS